MSSGRIAGRRGCPKDQTVKARAKRRADREADRKRYSGKARYLGIKGCQMSFWGSMGDTGSGGGAHRSKGSSSSRS